MRQFVCIGIVGTDGKYGGGVQRERQFDVFACKVDFVGIGCDAFDNEVVGIECGNFTDRRVKPVVAFALCQQGFCLCVKGLENLCVQGFCK